MTMTTMTAMATMNRKKIMQRKSGTIHIAILAILCVFVSTKTVHNGIGVQVMAFSASPPPSKTKITSTASTSSSIFKDEKERQQIQSLLDKQLSNCKSGTAARKVLNESLLPSDDNMNTNMNMNTLYNSLTIPRGASIRSISDAELAIQTNIRNNKYKIMELIELNGDKDADRASLALLTIFIGSTISAIVTQNNLPGPEIIRFVLSWILSFLPLIFVGLGLSIPNELQSTLIVIQSSFFPLYKKRMVHHEAGHFLIGHLLGMPIKGYRANAIKNAVEFYPLRDDDVGKSKASLLGFDKSSSSSSSNSNSNNLDSYDPSQDMQIIDRVGGFFEPGGRGEEEMINQSVFRNAKNYTDNPFLKISTQDDVKQSWPYRGFDQDTIDRLAIVSVAGVCSEILSFGNAEGGFADLGQLRQILNEAEPALDEKEMENIIRYSIGYTMGQLRRHLGALDDLIEVMERDGSVAECILAIEGCTNPSGASVMGIGSYEKTRREKIQSDGIGFIERFALGGKNADMEDKGVVEGKGGGDRKQTFQLTGDDPLYAALATAGIFLVWAFSGGLSLH
jgi:hypothetical protein